MRRPFALFAITAVITSTVGVAAGTSAAAAQPPSAPVSGSGFAGTLSHQTAPKQIIKIGPKIDGTASRNRAKRQQKLDLGPATAQINVTYTGFPAQAQAAFQAAVDTWAHIVHSSVPIEVAADWSNLSEIYGPGVLGAAGPSDYVTGFANQPTPGAYYPVALANAISQKDLLPSNFCRLAETGTPTGAEIQASFNSSPGVGWYFGTDGNVPSNKVDLESVVLHELGHGFGFAGTFNGLNPTNFSDSGKGYYGLSGTGSDPTIFDTFTSNASGTPLISPSYPNGSSNLGAVLRGGSLGGAKWNGQNGKDAFNGNRVPLYSPSSWEEGSSFSHLDEDTTAFDPGTANSLMTPELSPGEAQHAPGPIVQGMFQDMGWPSDAPVPTTSNGLYHPAAAVPLPRLMHQAAAKAGTIVDVPVTGKFGVPSNVTAVTVNVAVSNPSANGYWTALPGCKGAAGTPSVANYSPHQSRSSQVTLPVSKTGHIAVTLSAGTGDVYVDLVGWYSADGDRYHHLQNQQVAVSTAITAAKNLDVQVAGKAGVPASGATAVVLKARISASTAAGWLRVAPGGLIGQLPSLGYAKGETTSNLVTVPLGTGARAGLIHLQITAGKANVVLEAVGWYGASSVNGMVYHPAGPARYQRVLKGQDQVVSGLPDGAQVMLSVHIASPTSSGLLTSSPSGPGVMHGVQEYKKGQSTTGLIITTTNSVGQVRLRLTSGTATMYVDWVGYFGKV